MKKLLLIALLLASNGVCAEVSVSQINNALSKYCIPIPGVIKLMTMNSPVAVCLKLFIPRVKAVVAQVLAIQRNLSILSMTQIFADVNQDAQVVFSLKNQKVIIAVAVNTNYKSLDRREI